MVIDGIKCPSLVSTRENMVELHFSVGSRICNYFRGSPHSDNFISKIYHNSLILLPGIRCSKHKSQLLGLVGIIEQVVSKIEKFDRCTVLAYLFNTQPNSVTFLLVYFLHFQYKKKIF